MRRLMTPLTAIHEKLCFWWADVLHTDELPTLEDVREMLEDRSSREIEFVDGVEVVNVDVSNFHDLVDFLEEFLDVEGLTDDVD